MGGFNHRFMGLIFCFHNENVLMGDLMFSIGKKGGLKYIPLLRNRHVHEMG